MGESTAAFTAAQPRTRAAMPYQDDDGGEAVPKHRRDVLRRHLEGPVPDERQDALAAVGLLVEAVGDGGGPDARLGARGERVPERRANRPADGPVSHLHLVLAAVRQPQPLAVEPRVADLRGKGRFEGTGSLLADGLFFYHCMPFMPIGSIPTSEMSAVSDVRKFWMCLVITSDVS